MKATPIKLDVTTGFKVVSLLVADLTPFLALGLPVEITVGAPEIVTPPPALDTGNMPPPIRTEGITNAADKGIAEGAANAGNPNACTLCFGHGLVKEFAEGDTVGVVATCKTCGGTGIKPVLPVLSTPTEDMGAIKPCTECEGSGAESPGKPCFHCSGTGTEPANPPHTD